MIEFKQFESFYKDLYDTDMAVNVMEEVMQFKDKTKMKMFAIQFALGGRCNANNEIDINAIIFLERIFKGTKAASLFQKDINCIKSRTHSEDKKHECHRNIIQAVYQLENRDIDRVWGSIGLQRGVLIYTIRDRGYTIPCSLLFGSNLVPWEEDALNGQWGCLADVKKLDKDLSYQRKYDKKETFERDFCDQFEPQNNNSKRVESNKQKSVYAFIAYRHKERLLYGCCRNSAASEAEELAEIANHSYSTAKKYNMNEATGLTDTISAYTIRTEYMKEWKWSPLC